MKNKRNIIICPPCGESVLLRAKGGQKGKKTLWPLLTAVLPPQGREILRGFTLIELLVVILIIGILAAVALPQYNKAVLKARATEAITTLKTIADAEKRYYLEHGEYSFDLRKLDVVVPNKLAYWDIATACGRIDEEDETYVPVCQFRVYHAPYRFSYYLDVDQIACPFNDEKTESFCRLFSNSVDFCQGIDIEDGLIDCYYL